MIELNLEAYLNSSSGVISMVSKLCVGLVEAGTVNLKEICARFKTGKQASNYRAIQRFFQHKTLNDIDVIRYIIDHLFDQDEQLILAIDRTDWAFGQTRHNLLVVSILYKQTACSKYWSEKSD